MPKLVIKIPQLQSQGEITFSEANTLPKSLHINLCLLRDRLLNGLAEKCVVFELFKMTDADEQPKAIPPDFRLMSDDELQASKMMLSCLLRDIEMEVVERQDYFKNVHGEISGLTGSNSAGLDEEDGATNG